MKKLIFLKTAILFLTIGSFFTCYESKSEAALIPSVSSENLLINSSSDEREIFSLINKQRRKIGLKELNWSNELESLAREYSRKMAAERFFSHFERNGNSIVQRAKAMRVNGWRRIGENLFHSTPYDKLGKFAVEKWMSSPSHRRNIIDQNYTSTGIGIAQGRDGTIYITQVFTQDY